MNAYELADALQETEPYYSTDYKLFDNAANMIRQQADRIAELEKQTKQTPDGLIDPKSYYIGYADGKKAPQTKPLSDEEIWNWFKENTALTKESALRIARAIEERAWD